MKTYITSPDRIIRIIIFLVTVILYFTGTVTGTLGIVLMAVGGILLVTALINFCPIYYVLGIHPKKEKN